MKKTGLFALLTASAIMLTAGCGNGTAAKTAVKAGTESFSMADASIAISSYTTYGYDFDTAKEQVMKTFEKTFKEAALAKAMKIELDDTDKSNVISTKAGLIQQSGIGYKEYEKYLKNIGSSIKFVEEYATNLAYQSKLEKQLQEEIGTSTPTDEEMQQYFLDNYYRAKHILISEPENKGDAATSEEPSATPVADDEGHTGEELANVLLKRAQDGENFDEMITKYNQDPGMSSPDNADGYIFTDGSMVEEFENCVKNLKPGEFGIAKTSYGYHVIERLPLTKDEANFATWFDKSKSSIPSAMSEKKLDDKIEELCKENNITVDVDQSVVDAFTNDKLVTPPTAEPSTSAAGSSGASSSGASSSAQ